MKATIATAKIYKDGFKASRPWAADLHFPDGVVWKKWQSGYKTLTSVTLAIVAADNGVEIERHPGMDNGGQG